MTDKEKLEKAVKLANAMYHAAQYLTTDASGLHKAMEDYHQFIITEYNEQEPVSEDLAEAANNYGKKQYGKKIPFDLPDRCRGCYAPIVKGFEAGAQWQKEQMMKDAIGVKINRDTLYDLKPFIHEKYLDYKIGDKVKIIIIKE